MCAFLIRLYGKLGLKAVFAYEAGFGEKKSALCLSGREMYDIMIDGGKIGGNAQRHTRNALLQHGTLPMKRAEADFIPLMTDGAVTVEFRSLDSFGIETGYEQLAALLCESFEETFRAAMRP